MQHTFIEKKKKTLETSIGSNFSNPNKSICKNN